MVNGRDREAVVAIYDTVKGFCPFVAAFWKALSEPAEAGANKSDEAQAHNSREEI